MRARGYRRRDPDSMLEIRWINNSHSLCLVLLRTPQAMASKTIKKIIGYPEDQPPVVGVHDYIREHSGDPRQGVRQTLLTSDLVSYIGSRSSTTSRRSSQSLDGLAATVSKHLVTVWRDADL